MKDTNLVIPLTGQGVSALATVRLVGPLVRPFLEKHFSRIVEPGRIRHGVLNDDGRDIDDPVVALAEDSSFADVTLHGGVWVVRSFIDCAVRAGFHPATADEDPRLLFPESRSHLDAEVQAALPLARTELAVRTLLAQEKAWQEWVAASPDPASIRAVLKDNSLHHLLHPPTVAIIGLPNAGKSTLANQLFGTQRSIVSPIAGTTRDWVGEEANLDGLIVKLLDTPGLRTTHDPIERQAILQSRAPVDEAALVIVLLDASRSLAEQTHLLTGLREPLIAINKIDLNASAVAEASAAGLRAIGMNAPSQQGIDELVAAIHECFGIDRGSTSKPRIWTDQQRAGLLKALDEPQRLVEWLAR